LVSDGRKDPIDRQLWRDAQAMLGQHVQAEGRDECASCNGPWPCVARRVGERAELAAFKPWNEAWTVRHDLRSMDILPNWRNRAGSPGEPAYNRGTF
jgi:hypothetical protein